MGHAGDRESDREDRVSAAEEAVPAAWSLRPYQVASLKGISSAWASGQERTLLVLATGLGKTTVFAEVLRRRRDAGRGRALVLAHRIELVQQAADRCALAGLSVEVESGDRMANPHALLTGGCSDVVVATVQTLKGKRLDRWPAAAFGTVVVDEAHHAAALGYRVILDHFAAAKVLGVTATPQRGDDVALGHVFPHVAYDYGIRAGIQDGFLAPIKRIGIECPSIDLSTARTTKQEHGRDLSPEDIARAMRSDVSLHELAAPIAKETGNGVRPTLVFCPTVETAHALASVLAGYVGADKVRSLDGNSAKEDRARVLHEYQIGRVRYLVNCALFTEGFDAPHTSCVVVARPTKSKSLYTQMVGRGTRLSPGKDDCLVLDMCPEVADHDLVSVVDLFAGDDLEELDKRAVEAALARGESVLKAISDAEEGAKKREADRARERERAHLIAEAKYRRRERDPFEEMGIEHDPKTARGPRATERQLEALGAAGFRLTKKQLSRAEAGTLLDTLTRRRRDGLCTIKQMRQLAKHGLNPDLSFADARLAMDALAANGWRVSSAIAHRFGEPAE